MLSLNRVKISTGLAAVLILFFIMTVSITGYNLYTAFKSYDNLTKSNDISGNERLLARIKDSLSNAESLINLLTDRPNLDVSDINDTFNRVNKSAENATSALNAFMATPLLTTQRTEIADKIKGAFNNALLVIKSAETEARNTHYIALSKPRKMALNAVDNFTLQYMMANQKLSDEMSHIAKSNFNSSILITIISFILTLVISLVTWVWMRKQVIQNLALINQHLAEIGNGNLATTVESDSRNEIGMTIQGLMGMQNNLVTLITKVRNGAENITVGAGEIASGNNDLSSRTEEQAAALQETAASMEQIKMTVRQNADNANQANDLASSAKQLALEGGKAAEETRSIMDAIQESSKAISEINSVITSIASQTNILALNAAVEAARAGEQGRGFAVVAGEVRNLAQRSSTAAQEIRSLIDQTTTKVGNGVQLVIETNKKIENAIDSVTKVSDLMEEIKIAAEEQNVGIAQVSQAITEMDTVTQQNAALVEQAAAASASLNDQAQQLAQEVSFFKLCDSHLTAGKVKAPLAPVRTEKRAAVKKQPVLSSTVTKKSSASEDNWEEF